MSNDGNNDFEILPIDQGFDFVNFPNLSVDKQIASIPLPFMEDLKFGEFTSARSHSTCLVKKHPKNHGGAWACDMIEGASACLSGLEDFYKSKGIEGWSCTKCDWDMCIKCMQADKFIEMITNRED